MCVVFTVLTLGIYYIYWFYKNAENQRLLCGESTRGIGNETFLSLFFGIFYHPYWYFTRMKQVRDKAADAVYEGYIKTPVVYLLLALFGMEIIAKIMWTVTCNKIANLAEGKAKEDTEPTREGKTYLRKRCGLLKLILLSILTLGIYWQVNVYRMANKVKLINGQPKASGGRVIALLLFVPYLLYWLIAKSGKLDRGGNRATIEAYCLLAIPFYSIYWYVTRASELSAGARRVGIQIGDETIWTLIFATFALPLCTLTMQLNLNRIADNLYLGVGE